MHSLHHFQLPRRPRSRRGSSASHKRKRDESGEEINSDENAATLPQSSTQVSAPPGITSLTTNQAEQYRAAGLSPSGEIPPEPFPHSSLDGIRRRRRSRKRGESTDATLKTHEVRDFATGGTTLRQTHIAVLTTMMHRCLLERDYERAGKAWALLLRSGEDLDFRRVDRWGIGAEILMRKHSSAAFLQEREDDARSVSSDDVEEEKPYFPTSSYTHEGFEAAKLYYERLIVQYPDLRKTNSRDLARAASFYPALFSVWLRQVAVARRQAVASLDTESVHEPHSERSDSRDASQLAEHGIAVASDARRQQRMERVEASELQEAREIAERLDALLQRPPLDHDPTLLDLRGMVSLWLADLVCPAERDEDLADPDGSASTSPEFDQDSRRRAQWNARREQLDKAERSFREAINVGGDGAFGQ